MSQAMTTRLAGLLALVCDERGVPNAVSPRELPREQGLSPMIVGRTLRRNLDMVNRDLAQYGYRVTDYEDHGAGVGMRISLDSAAPNKTTKHDKDLVAAVRAALHDIAKPTDADMSAAIEWAITQRQRVFSTGGSEVVAEVLKADRIWRALVAISSMIRVTP